MFVNPCGGARWETKGDGSIEVEGQGVPLYEPGTARFAFLEQTYGNFSSSFHAAARKHALPVSWLLAIAAVETGPWSGEASTQAAIVSPAGAIGIMQLMPATASMLGFSPASMTDPDANIDAGATLLAQLSVRFPDGLPAITAPYNSGRLCCGGACGADCTNPFALCTDSDYPGAAIRYNNTALTYLDLRPRGSLIAGVVIGAAGLYAAAVLARLTKPPAFARHLL